MVLNIEAFCPIYVLSTYCQMTFHPGELLAHETCVVATQVFTLMPKMCNRGTLMAVMRIPLNTMGVSRGVEFNQAKCDKGTVVEPGGKKAAALSSILINPASTLHLPLSLHIQDPR